MRNSFDWTPYRRSTVGFDRLFDFLETGGSGAENYPPFHIEKVSDAHFRIPVAVPGFKPHDIDIPAQQHLLTSSRRHTPVRAAAPPHFPYIVISSPPFYPLFTLSFFILF